ncbi:MAG: FAD-dependent oxidoreductase [Acutalibacteraceae bacterium]|nr:FAD-dependent oxidoreductase [Acutalibacteraceae bacterium]
MSTIWQKDFCLPEFPPLNSDIKTDVLVIGGGMAGILTAFTLKQNGVDCVLVEKGRIANGTTCGTTAKITYQHGLIFRKILKQYGKEGAEKFLFSGRLALENFKNLSNTFECDFEQKTNYVYSVSDEKILHDEMAALDVINHKARLQKNLEIPVNSVGAVKIDNQAQFNPLKFISGIAKDLHVYENTHIKDIIGTCAYTNKYKIYAKKIIVTTHFPFIDKHGSYFLKLYQHRSYMVALENAQMLDGMYVDEAKVGYTFRNHKDLLILGGGDHRTGKKGGGLDEVRNFYKVHYPYTKEITHWAAQDCMSLDELPYIGYYSKNTPDMLVATGFNKWGMTSSMTAAYVLTDLILGRQNDYADIFSPTRSILKPQLLINTAETTLNLIRPTAPRCTHLGCALKWNKAEHSWDCGCHGSRFDKNGTILNNPANKNLH